MTQLVWGSLSLVAVVVALVVWATGGAHFTVVVVLLLAAIFALWTIAPRPTRPQLPPRP